MMQRTPALALAALMACAAPVAVAADIDPPVESAKTDPLAAARALIADKKWAAAIKELERVNLPRNADWNNLLGYSHRRAATPDLAAAQRYYDVALRIDPKHRGALEYSGELYLRLGDLPKAEQRLVALVNSCGNCEEKQDLDAAIAAFKANGNRYVPKP